MSFKVERKAVSKLLNFHRDPQPPSFLANSLRRRQSAVSLHLEGDETSEEVNLLLIFCIIQP